ncbi:MAG TPA: hypothetical protein VMS99_01275 [Acidimicrobiia bacterium]|nr:hypothetical protein [Acidimicrobiia bacterium]
MFPWLYALAAVLFVFCCMGLLAAHSPSPGGWMLLGSWWTALAFLGSAGGFLAIADDTAETVGSTVILGIMALVWVLIGLSIRAAVSKAGVAAFSATEGTRQ